MRVIGVAVITGVIVIIGAGIWLRWAAKPALIAFWIGRELGRGQGARAEAARRGQRLPQEKPESVGGGS